MQKKLTYFIIPCLLISKSIVSEIIQPIEDPSPNRNTYNERVYPLPGSRQVQTGQGSTVIINYDNQYAPGSPASSQPQPPAQTPTRFLEYQAPNRVLEPDRFGPPKRRAPDDDPFQYRPLPR